MWQYQKRLEYPVNIKNTNPGLAAYIVAQYGGPNGELAASLRYLSQRYSMPDEVTKSLLTDIGTEGLKCSHFGHQRLIPNSALPSICMGASSNKHQCPLCCVPLFFQ